MNARAALTCCLLVVLGLTGDCPAQSVWKIGTARARGEKPKGPVDHDVPVLAARDPGGALRAIVFGYACHNTTLGILQWCGDYAGFAQIALEKRHPDTLALFHMGRGADQNPLPRRTVELCQQYGSRLAAAVDVVLTGPMRPPAGCGPGWKSSTSPTGNSPPRPSSKN